MYSAIRAPPTKSRIHISSPIGGRTERKKIIYSKLKTRVWCKWNWYIHWRARSSNSLNVTHLLWRARLHRARWFFLSAYTYLPYRTSIFPLFYFPFFLLDVTCPSLHNSVAFYYVARSTTPTAFIYHRIDYYLPEQTAAHERFWLLNIRMAVHSSLVIKAKCFTIRQ